MKIGIIGGGAAGLMAAWSAAEHHPEARVVLLERNAVLGQKVMISGGGPQRAGIGHDTNKAHGRRTVEIPDAHGY